MLVLDALLLILAMGLAVWLHAGLRQLTPWLKPLPGRGEYLTAVYLALPLWLSLLALLRLHEVLERPLTLRALAVRLLQQHALGLLGLTIVLFLTQSTINRSLIALFLGCSFLLLLAQRAGLNLWARRQHRRGVGRARLLLVGWPGAAMSSFARAAAAQPFPPLILGHLAPDEDPPADLAPADPAGPPLPRLGTAPELATLLHEEAVDRVLFFPPYHRPGDLPGALLACQTLGLPADFSLQPPGAGTTRPQLATLWQAPFLTFPAAPLRGEALAAKHALDLLLAGLALALLAPLLLLIAAAVLALMGRPVFFAQERIGLNGRRFRMFKFRTMVPGAEARRGEVLVGNEMSGPVFKAASDPRTTALGRLLRRTSLDELPQLLNILRGEMSLVGPRPLPVPEQQEIRGAYRRRLSMRPGITGLWQVSGRNEVDFEDWMAMDLRYVSQWSLGLDLRILLRTIPAVLTRKGAR